jgi:hypothetical protein
MGGWGVSLVPGQPAEIHVKSAAPIVATNAEPAARESQSAQRR